MDWLSQMLGKLIGLKNKDRAMSMDNLMQKVYAKMYEMEEANDTYYSLARFMVDEGGLWVVFNEHGSLFRANISISDKGEVALSDLQEVEETYLPIKQNSIFLRRQADGTARVYLVAATSILNRVNEIDSRKLFDNMIRHAEEANYYPAIDIHHLGSSDPEIFDIGYIDYLARFGVTYVASGIIDETKELGRRMVETLERDSKNEWGCSIEYFALDKESLNLKVGDNGTIPIDVYTDGVNTRISLLPEQRAANWFTKASIKERSMSELTKDAALTLRKLFGSDEEFSAFIEQLGGINDAVEKRGLVNREAEAESEKSEQLDPEGDPKEEASDDASETEPVEREVEKEIVLDEETVSLIAQKVLELTQTADAVEREKAVDSKLDSILTTLLSLAKKVEGQDSRLQELERSQDQNQQEWLADLSPRLRERVVVTHRPTQAAGEGEQLKTAQQIADSTLSKIPSLAA